MLGWWKRFRRTFEIAPSACPTFGGLASVRASHASCHIDDTENKPLQKVPVTFSSLSCLQPHSHPNTLCNGITIDTLTFVHAEIDKLWTSTNSYCYACYNRRADVCINTTMKLKSHHHAHHAWNETMPCSPILFLSIPTTTNNSVLTLWPTTVTLMVCS